MSLTLLKKTTLTFTRFDEGKELTEDGDFVFTGTTSDFDAIGNLQPFTKTQNFVLPEGATTQDSRIFYTRTKLRTTSSQADKIYADKTTIDEVTYVCFGVEDWSLNSLTPDHYSCLLIREDQAS